MKMTMGETEIELGGKYLGLLRDANDVIDDVDGLNSRMDEDGYLLLRGLQRRENVAAVREQMLESLAANGQIDTAFPLEEAVAIEGAKGHFFGGRKEMTHTSEFLSVVQSPEIMGFFATMLGGKPLTYDYKWLRVVGPGDNTGAHYDVVYMGRGTDRVYTCWTPMGDVGLELGPLAVLVGSHRFEEVKETYGKMDVDRDKVDGLFSNDPVELVDRFGGQWQTASFEMGDVLILSMYTMHGSLNNQTNRFRISSDTRYQRADEPVDERWMGDKPMAHYAWHEGETVDMSLMREKWGV